MWCQAGVGQIGFVPTAIAVRVSAKTIFNIPILDNPHRSVRCARVEDKWKLDSILTYQLLEQLQNRINVVAV